MRRLKRMVTKAPRRPNALPAGPAAYVALATLAAVALFVYAFLATLPHLGFALLGGTVAFAAGFLLLERQAVVLVWDRERVTAALTEVAVLLGLLALPPAALILAVPVPRIAMGIATRRPLVKSLFNVATGVLSVGAAWGAFALGLQAGASPLVAAVLGTAAYAVSADLLMAGLFGFLEHSFFFSVYRARFLRPNVLAVVYGVAAGVTLYALWSLHPAAVLAAAPLLWLLHRYTAYEARADREISLYKSLARESQALIGVDRREAIAERTLTLSMAGLGAPKVTLRLENGATWERTDAPGNVGAQPWLSAPILGREARRLGEMAVWRRPGRRSDPVHDEALLRIIASQTGHALESAEALLEVARQRDVVARQEKLSALGSIVAGVAHEVNNPLTYLGGNVELAMLDLEDLQARYAENGETPPIDIVETHRLLATALGGAERIGEIVKALRAVARTRGTTERERVPMNKITQNVCELMKIGVPERILLRCEPDAQDPAVMGFSSELHQVVLNLAKNAVEATTDRGGSVVVAVACTADRVELRVTDDGVGMDEETRKRLFTPFFTTKGASGTGLGLSIVGSIVKEHGGEITVDSVAGKGTTFRVTLPRV